jgi:hypothetical protein
MFEQPAGKEEKDRSRSIMILSAIAVVVVIVLIVLATSFGKRPATEALFKAGAPEFDAYVQFITINEVSKYHGVRMNTRYGRMECGVGNEGDRVVEALQLRAFAVGFNNEVLKEKILNAVPGSADSLPPGTSVRMEIYLEPIPDPTTIMDMKIEVFAFRLK